MNSRKWNFWSLSRFLIETLLLCLQNYIFIYLRNLMHQYGLKRLEDFSEQVFQASTVWNKLLSLRRGSLVAPQGARVFSCSKLAFGDIMRFQLCSVNRRKPFSWDMRWLLDWMRSFRRKLLGFSDMVWKNEQRRPKRSCLICMCFECDSVDGKVFIFSLFTVQISLLCIGYKMV